MKFLFCLIAASLLASFTSTETCQGTVQCDHVNCDSQYMLECVRGECTCSHHTICDLPEDCGLGSNSSLPDDGEYFEDDAHCRHPWHCVDKLCRCGFGEDFEHGHGH